MTDQYFRKVSLILGNDREAIDLSNLRFKFQVRRGDIQTPNSVDIRVYNVSDQTLNQVQKEFKRVVLQAGYDGNFGVIFQGNVKQLRKGRESAVDSYLDLTAADGDSAYHFAVVNRSLSAGSTPLDQFKASLTAMAGHGVVGASTAELHERTLPRGKTMFGMARDFMRSLAGSTQTDWSIQDEQLTLIPASAYLPGEAAVLTAATGMVGFPEQTQDGIKVRCLLNPNLKIGTRVKIDNQSILRFKFGLSLGAFKNNMFVPSVQNDGFYRIIFAEHAGDTRGQEWYTSLTCVGVNSNIPPSLLTRTAVAPG